MRRTFFMLLRFGIAIGLLAYLVESRVINPLVLRRLLSSWNTTVEALLLLLLDLALMALRLCWLFRAREISLSFNSSLQLTSLSSFFATFLPGRAGGDVARLFYASRDNTGRRAEIVAILLLDRAIGLFSLILLPLLIAPAFPALLDIAAVRIMLLVLALLAAAMLTGFLICLWAPRWMDWLSGRVPQRLLGRGDIAVRSLGTIAAYRNNPGTLLGTLAISLSDNLMAIGVLALALGIVHPASVEAKLMVMTPMAQIVNSLPLTPGGLGIGEAAYNALFNIAGMPGGADSLLCWRIWNAVVGLMGLFFYLRGVRVRVTATRAKKPRALMG